MGIVSQIALVVLGISFTVFVSFFGSLPVFRRTPIGFLHRLIWIHMPNGLAKIDQFVTGGRLGSSLKRTGHYLMHDKHPIVLIFFLALLLISELLSIPPSLPLLPTTFSRPSILSLHYILIPLLITPPYLFLHLSHRTPSTITPLNHSSAMRTYPYDHTIFYSPPNPHPNPDSNSSGRYYYPSPFTQPPCRTCLLPKPARSKHCSICKCCIQKADHHCIWINNCVGRNNYIYFLGLMLSVSVLLIYGAYLGYKILDMQLQLRSQHSSSPSSRSTSPAATNANVNLNPHWSTDSSWRAYAAHWADILALHPLIAGPSLLALLSFPLAAGLTIYHVYLIWAGMTTNESGKWADLREDIAEGIVWRGKVGELKGDFPELGSREGEEEEEEQEEEGGMDGESRGKGFKWPVKPRWAVIRMNEVGRRPRIRRQKQRLDGTRVGVDGEVDAQSRDGNGDQWEDDERWMQVRNLSDIENIYDLGFWENLRDVFVNRE